MKTTSTSPDILLLAPGLPDTSWLNSAVAGVTPPLGLAYLAAWLRAAGFRVEIIDNAVERQSPDELGRTAARISPTLVGLTATTTNFPSLLELAGAVKHWSPNIPVVAGGPHASALPELVAEQPSIDFVVRGEGEETLTELLRLLAAGEDPTEVLGVTCVKDGRVINNPPRPPIADLDSLPPPAYDLLPMERYHPSLSRRITRSNMGSIVTSRGCPFACTFCSNSVFGSSLRVRSVDSVLDEVALLKRRHHIHELLIWDDTFTMDRGRSMEIARGIKAVADLPWSCYSRVDHADQELYRVFADNGCRELLFGAESGDETVLAATRKGITTGDTRRAVALCREAGISSFCSVVLGLPGDNRETLERTIDFFVDLGPDYAAFCILIPFPGTELFRTAVAQGLLDPRRTDWRTFVKIFSSTLPPVTLCDLPAEELVAIQKRAFRRFFLDPRYVAGRARRALVEGLLHRLDSFSRGLLTVLRHQLHRFGDRRATEGEDR